MNIAEIIELIMDQLCLQPILWVICLPALSIGFNLFTLKATTERIRAAQKEGRSIIPTLILALASPIWFIFALGLLIISFLVAPGLYLLLIGILVLGIPLAGLAYFFLRFPDILGYLWELIGPFGERLLHFIETSPQRVLTKLDNAWGTVIAQVILYFTKRSHPKLLKDPLVRIILNWIGLSSETLIEQYLHNPFINHKDPIKLIHSLGKMHALQSLLRLGRNPTTKENIRMMAASELEFLHANDEAAMIWKMLGHRSPNIAYQMQAAEHLMRLREIEESQQILNKILEKVDRYPRWIDKAHSLQRHLNRFTDKVETPTLPSAQDPAYRLRSARILVNDKLTDKAAELLGEIIVSNDSDLHARHQAIQDFQSYGMRDSLLKLLETPELPAELQYLVIQSLERLGDCALAMREYGKLAQTESVPLQNRTDAAVALARLDQSESTHDLLLSLACHPERNSQLRTKLAWTLQQAGWRNEASQVLTELIEDPATNREARKIAERDLARMKIR